MSKLITTIKPKYYFLSQGGNIIIEISNYQDADGCGICPSLNDEGKQKTDTELAAIFPYILLTYSVYNKDRSGYDKTGQKKYMWLQEFIYDGDKYEGETFKCTMGLHKDDSATFLDRYIKQTKNEVYNSIINGYSNTETLKKEYPKYLSETTYDDYIDGNKVTVTATSLTDVQRILSDENIGQLYVDAAKYAAEKSANKVLKLNEKKVKENTLGFETENIE